MAQRQTDPSRLSGATLQRWYRRSTSEIEQEQRSASEDARRAFYNQVGVSESRPPKMVEETVSRSRPVLADSQVSSPIDFAKDALEDFQKGPKIPRPNLAESFIPVVGPAWEAAGDLQDGNYGGAAFNAAMAVGDVLPVGALVKGLKAARKGIGVLKKGSVTAGAAAKKIRRAGLAGPGEEIHHTVPLDGLGRSVQDWRNHYAFLKTLPRETHRRLTGSWMGAPKFGPVMRAWHGTSDWQKSVPAAVAAISADAWENLRHPFDQKSPGGRPARK